MTSNNRIEKVALVGAGGNSGKHMTEQLLKTGKHKVTAITREGSQSKLPEGLEVATIDYNDQSSIVKALKGQDALVITMGVSAPEGQQQKLIDAAVEAGVPWVLPNEWGPDSANEAMSMGMLVGKKLKETREYLDKVGKISWIAVSCGFWYEWSLSIPGAFGIDLKNKTADFYGDGSVRMNTSTWPQNGRAVAALLSLKVKADGPDDKEPCLEQFRNSWVYPTSFLVSQQDMLDSAIRVSGTKAEDWTVTKEPAEERYKKAMSDLQQGDHSAFITAMYTRPFFVDEPQNMEKHRRVDNEVLGLPKEDLDEATKVAMDMYEGMAQWMKNARG